MEKKIVSIESLPDGEQHVALTEQCLEERVNRKVELLYKHYYGSKVTISGDFLVNTKDDEVMSMTLSYRITESPSPVEKYSLEATCYTFFNLNFKTKEDGSVWFHADNTFDMALLMQALASVTIDIDCWFMPIDINKSVKDARAMVHQQELDFLQSAEAEEMEYNLEEETSYVIDEHHVAYSKDGKTLLFAKAEFDEAEYRVPDGVEEIADDAFLWCHIPVRLIVPRTVKRIGFEIFGYNGGQIEIIAE